MSNSALLAAVTSLMTNPLLAGLAGDPNQKVVRIANYLSQLVKAVNNNNQTRYEIQIPPSSSLVSMYFDGIDSESEVLGLANQVDLAGSSWLLRLLCKSATTRKTAQNYHPSCVQPFIKSGPEGASG